MRNLSSCRHLLCGYGRHILRLPARTFRQRLILVSSLAGFQESPGLFVHQAAKHGVIGLMRSLRKYFPAAYGNIDISVNCVCPGATETAMTVAFTEGWKNEGLPLNTLEVVARIIVGVSVDEKLSGESIFVEGDRGWAFEGGLDRTQPQWHGEVATSTVTRGQAFLSNG
jgi:NAD(P)-dependent dehydrogenase (short-subunit alcohol dehydrogenase family)